MKKKILSDEQRNAIDNWIMIQKSHPSFRQQSLLSISFPIHLFNGRELLESIEFRIKELNERQE